MFCFLFVLFFFSLIIKHWKISASKDHNFCFVFICSFLFSLIIKHWKISVRITNFVFICLFSFFFTYWTLESKCKDHSFCFVFLFVNFLFVCFTFSFFTKCSHKFSNSGTMLIVSWPSHILFFEGILYIRKLLSSWCK